MQKINFLAGDEQRFLDFVSSIKETDKIALLSHVDLDGIGAAKVVSEAVHPDMIELVNYIELNKDIVEKLKQNKITTLILTDLCVYRPFVELLNDFKVLIIDHHPPPEDFNSENVVFMNSQGYCGAYLSYYLFSKVKNLSKIDWLAACSCIADWAYFENQEWMKEIFQKYGDEFVIEDKTIRKNGTFWELQHKLSLALIYFRDNLKKVLASIGENFGDIGDLEKYIGEVQKEIDENVEKFQKEKQIINGRIFWEFSPKFKVGSIVINIVSSNHFHETVIVGRSEPDGKFYSFSARRQDKRENMSELLKKLTSGLEDSEGGGHIAAAGGHVLLKDKEIFMQRLKTI